MIWIAVGGCVTIVVGELLFVLWHLLYRRTKQ